MSAPIVRRRRRAPLAALLAGPVAAGPVLVGPVLAGPILAGTVLAGTMLAAAPALAQAQAAPDASAQAQPAPQQPAANLAPAQPAAGNGAVAALLNQASYWRTQNRPEQVLRIFERVLVVEPRNIDALTGAAEAAGQLGNRAQAEDYLARVRQAAPADPRLTQAQVAVRVATADQGEVAAARTAARSGNGAEAVRRYRAMFGGNQPPDALAVEYYQTLAGTPGGFDEARDGLARLAARTAGDNRAQLALAEVLTYRDATRADGIARLRQLAANPGASEAAVNAWRQALLFSGPGPAVIPGLEAFLQAHPDDAAIRQRLADSRDPHFAGPADAAGEARARGFEQLNHGRLAEAERGFRSALDSDGADADALGGLGIVRLRQGRNAEARQLLERAIAADPSSRPRWQRALDGAAAADALAGTRTQVARGQLDAADAALRQIVRRDGGDRAEAEALLGDIALRRGDTQAAETHFRDALSRRPELQAALVGLGTALQQQGRFAEAEELLRRAGPTAAAGAARQRADALRTQADRTQDPEAALQLLRDAVAADPSSPWARLDLARALRQGGRTAEARAAMDTSGLAQPSAEQLYAAALFAREDNRNADAAALLDRIPARLRSADMSRLLAQVRQADEVRAAAALAAAGQPEGRARLLAVASRPDPTGAAAAEAVRAFGRLGDRAGVAEALRRYQAANPATPATRIVLAGALLEAGEEGAALALTEGLDNSVALTADQRRSLAGLRSGIAIRSADQLNTAGNQAAAYDQLAPLLVADPANTGANLALARLYQGARQPQQAEEVAEAALQREPRNLDVLIAAADAALAAGHNRRADSLLAEARALDPNDPRLSLLDARIARVTGDYRRALRAVELAAAQRRLQTGEAAPVIATPSGAASPPPASSGNPFRRDPMLAATPSPTMIAVADSAMADPLSAEIARELQRAREDAGTRLAASAAIRTRSGSSGLDRLTEFSAPVEASFVPPGIGGRVAARVTPVSIDGGDLGTSVTSSRAFGTNALSGLTATSATPNLLAAIAPRGASASGVALGLGYARNSFSLDVGSTPLGFRRDGFGAGSSLVGGIEVAPSLSDSVRLRLTGERRAITDSVLSWAGQRDARTGISWGGVSRTGGRAQLELTAGNVTAYVGGGYATVDGEHVRKNNVASAGAGLAWTLFRTVADEVIAGADLTYFAYDNNQRAFTLGNGGYFSPQSYVAASLPVDWRGRRGDFAFHVGGTIGYQNYRERGENLFPYGGDAALQSQLVSLAAGDPTLTTRTNGQTQSGIIGGVRGDIEYAITPSLRVGALLRYDRTASWNEARGLFFARYRFDQ